jgi:hypothetical protein
VDRALQYTSKQLGEGTKLAIVEPNAKSKREVPPNPVSQMPVSQMPVSQMPVYPPQQPAIIQQ